MAFRSESFYLLSGFGIIEPTKKLLEYPVLYPLFIIQKLHLKNENS